MNKKLGVIVLNYNTYEETVECVESIIKFTTISYKIYIVDNCSPDNSYKKLYKKFHKYENISLIKTNYNGGYSAGNNIGIKKAIYEGCEVICILNSDVELKNNALELMYYKLISSDNYIVAGPAIVNLERKNGQFARKTFNYKYFITERHPLCLIPFIKNNFSRYEKFNNNEDYVFNGMVSGCCFMVRGKDFKRLRYFDENVFLYYEEDILAYKINKLKKKVVIVHNAKVLHKENCSTNKSGQAFVRFHRWTSVLYYLKKYSEINRLNLLFVGLSNIFTWIFLSIFDNSYRVICIDFIKKNIKQMMS